MTDPGAGNQDDERIRAAAAAWVVRLDRGPSARTQRALDRWLTTDPRHAVAYRRVASRVDGARVLRRSRAYAARPEPVRPRRTLMIAGVLAMIALATLLILPFLSRPSHHDRVDDRKIATSGLVREEMPVRIGNGRGGIKSVGLADGSVITLDTGTIVEAAFTSSTRHVMLVRGRARFTVAHEKRPFTVFAGGGSVLARGTIFDVSLTPSGNVGVSLLQGVVDVAPTSMPGASLVQVLQRGERIDYAAGAVVQRRRTSHGRSEQWVVGGFEFDNVPLGYVLRAADRGDGPSIVVTDAALARLRVSGHFDTSDRSRLAKNLARLFDLHMRATKDSIELSPR